MFVFVFPMETLINPAPTVLVVVVAVADHLARGRVYHTRVSRPHWSTAAAAPANQASSHHGSGAHATHDLLQYLPDEELRTTATIRAVYTI